MICAKCPAKIPLLKIDKNVKRAIKIRLQFIYDQELRAYQHWLEHIKPRLKATRSDQLNRQYRQRLQALRIVLWMLTPNMERDDDFPGFWKN